MRNIVLSAMVKELTSVAYVSVHQTILEGTVNALQPTLVSKESGRQAVGRTTQLRHFVTTAETAFVESVSACQEITQKKLYQESFVSVTTSPVTDIKEKVNE